MHPDTDLVADILGQRPDVGASSLPPPPIKDERPPTWQLPVSVADPVSCGGHLMAKVNEVNTLFSPGEYYKRKLSMRLCEEAALFLLVPPFFWER